MLNDWSWHPSMYERTGDKMGVGKTSYREKTCIDCGAKMVMYQSRKRCPKCAAKHNREYQILYARNLRAEMRAIRESEYDLLLTKVVEGVLQGN